MRTCTNIVPRVASSLESGVGNLGLLAYFPWHWNRGSFVCPSLGVKLHPRYPFLRPCTRPLIYHPPQWPRMPCLHSCSSRCLTAASVLPANVHPNHLYSPPRRPMWPPCSGSPPSSQHRHHRQLFCGNVPRSCRGALRTCTRPRGHDMTISLSQLAMELVLLSVLQQMGG